MIGELLVLLGAAFLFVAGVGVLRFDDVFSRMHAVGKGSAIGILLVVAGGLVSLHRANDITFLALAVILHVVTSPIGNNVLARAMYYAEGIPHGIDDVDELAECRAVEGKDHAAEH